MKTLSKPLQSKPKWTSYMQCFVALSDYLGLGHSEAWIYGISAHAFIINIHPELCPSSATCFSTAPLDELAKNLGFSVQTKSYSKHDAGFEAGQKELWETAKGKIDKGMPVIGWDLKIPEYYIIHGYDKDNYLFYDTDGTTQKIEWKLLGLGDIAIGSIKAIERVAPSKDLPKMLIDVFRVTLDFAKGNKEWVYPGYFSGLQAYKKWIDAVQAGKSNHFGAVYNAKVWAECRNYGYLFLQEAGKKLKSKLMDGLIEHYEVTAWALQKVAGSFTAQNADQSLTDIDSVIDNLYLAKEAEKAALDEMKLIISQL